MKKLKAANLVVLGLASMTVVCLAGSSLGTLAWYAYSTRAKMAYSGTAVRQTEQLQIGLLWGSTGKSRDTTFEEDYGVEYTVLGENAYYFMPAGTGFSSSAINYYLQKNGSATVELAPVSSRVYSRSADYKSGSEFKLYSAPSYTHGLSDVKALSRDYSVLPFAFRILSSTVEGFVPDQDIWMTGAVAQAEGTKDVSDAVRVHTKNLSNGVEFILSPNAETKGTTKVAGLLDLNGDHYYDFVRDGADFKELIYGQLDGEIAMSSEIFASDVAGADADINGTGGTSVETTDMSTFYAMHREGVEGYRAFPSDSRLEASYLCVDDIKPTNEDEDGKFQGGVPIAHTSDDEIALARVDLTVYLEGWDHSIINNNIDAMFNLGLQFEIDRV